MVGAAAIFLFALIVSGATADVIHIDGLDTDWTSPDSVHVDGDEAMLDQWDIDVTYYEWDSLNGYMNFAFYTIDPLDTSASGDKCYIMLDVPVFDDPAGTPVTGGPTDIDYYIDWQMDGAQPVLRNGVDDSIVAGASPTVAYSGNFVEFQLASYYVGTPGEFQWGAYLDDGGGSADDYAPDSYEQRGYTPEPTTLVLLPLGLAGLAAWRRRREA